MTEVEAANVRRWLLEEHTATLATLSVDPRCPGYPFCSIVPFALDARGRPLIQIASIAAHTKNLQADPRTSLFVHEPTKDGGDPQAGWRITVVGQMKRVSDADLPEAMARVVERVPHARAYENTHDFALWCLDIEHVRYIGGFGKIGWVEGADAVRDPLGGGLSDAAAGAIDHMNKDHATSMIDMCTGLAGFTPQRAEMISVDRAGMVVKTFEPDRLAHFSFNKEITAPDLRHAVVDVVKRARIATAAALAKAATPPQAPA